MSSTNKTKRHCGPMQLNTTGPSKGHGKKILAFPKKHNCIGNKFFLARQDKKKFFLFRQQLSRGPR